MIFPATYSRLMARELKLDARGQQSLLEGTALTPEALFRLDQWVDEDTQFTIIRNVIRMSGDPSFGLHWGSRLHISSHGPLGMVIASSPTLGEALANIERFGTVRGEFVEVFLHEEDGFLILRLQLKMPLDDVGLFFMEALVTTMQQNIRLILGRWMHEGRIELGYPAPAHAERYADYLHCPYRFDAAETRLLIPVALADIPNPLSDNEAYAQAKLRCEQVIQAQRDERSWRQRVSDLIRQHPGQLWTLQEISDHLGLSTRTLMRHLKAEGMSYQTLLDAELGRQAKILLSSPRYTVESVTLALGYHEVSAFRRAFKRWFGISPSEYRQQNLAP